ncbi:MAG: Gldg family protein [Pirellulales bacterium]|nr:Gldg family protein [Pirellulales bacterium]
MNWNVLNSIFRRDFVSYFSSPTGYVFICVFVVLSALATFWPPEFFSSNLANLDQLSRWLPFIMLVFIPAITMSIWAEERRQGTDELLLTSPASDFDVVLGKYMAGVAIFSVSLMFSAFSIFLVFKWGLGDPDGGLFVSTFIGYWFIGIAMIAIGMIASFLTDNLTVGFILGTLFNLPLALFGVAGWFVSNPALAEVVRRWSALERFRDFERGVLGIGGMAYFVAIAAVMLYLCMVLIGRRHWEGRENGSGLLGHYAVRTIALLAVAVGITEVAQNRNWLHADISSEQLSSLSSDTIQILRNLRNDENARTIKIDVYVSPQVPTEYADTKLSLLSTLAEMRTLSGNKVQVTKHEIENYGAEALLAEQNFGITPQEVLINTGGEPSREEFLLAAAVTSGLGKVVIPFVDKGIPVEYELVRSISTVTQEKRLKVGIVDTGIPFMNPSSNRDQEWPLISELRKQYDIQDSAIDPAQPIKGKYDVLIAIQPSMLGPQQMDHFVDAVRSGIPTLILEDPFPLFFRSVAGTAEPKQPQGMMGMFGGGRPEPKGDLEQLWRTLGVEFQGTEVVWQEYEPESTLRAQSDSQWIFIDRGNGAQDPLNSDNAITSGLNQLLLIYPGSITKAEDSSLEFEELAVTGGNGSGIVPTRAIRRQASNPRTISHFVDSSSHIMAAQIYGVRQDDELLGGAPSDPHSNLSAALDEPSTTSAVMAGGDASIHAVVVADIDWIIPDFFTIRQSGNREILTATQNVTFILNCIDALAGDQRFIEIRKRARVHRTLAKIDEATKANRQKALLQENEFLDDIQSNISEARKAFDDRVAAVMNAQDLTRAQQEQQIEVVRMREQERLDAQLRSIEAGRSRQLKQINYNLEQEISSVQNLYKRFAILIPPIPPLLVALYVFFRRREAEREGIAKARLR